MNSLIDFSLLSRLIEQAASGSEETYEGELQPPEVITLADREKKSKNKVKKNKKKKKK